MPLNASSSNIVVAVIDSGVDPAGILDAPAVAGINLSGDGKDGDTLDRFGHGTQVAGTIIRSAPSAVILPIKLMGDRGYLCHPERLEAAFEWILANRARHQIGVICAAFADAGCHACDADFRGSTLQTLVARLRDSGVPTVAPAGNWFRAGHYHGGQGMAWPAILREVVSVGALYRKAGRLALEASTQRLQPRQGGPCHTTLFAIPGPPGGTSGAAAVIAGRLAALRGQHPAASVSQLLMRVVERRDPDCVDGAGPCLP
jgi:subtilisin family serine protease